MCPEFQKVVDAAIQLVEDEVGLKDMRLDDWEYWAHVHEKNMSTDIHTHHPMVFPVCITSMFQKEAVTSCSFQNRSSFPLRWFPVSKVNFWYSLVG